jgi:hypothetical protein
MVFAALRFSWPRLAPVITSRMQHRLIRKTGATLSDRAGFLLSDELCVV